MSAPLVSVVIASWNAGKYLPQTLESALSQTWPRCEIIVIDDGSTDDTREAIAEFLPKIRYEQRRHRGLAAARNEGIGLSTGAYVALLDADDLWHPTKLATQMEIAARRPGAGLIVCDGVEFSDQTPMIGPLLAERFRSAIEAAPLGEAEGDFQRHFIMGCGISCPAQVLIPRSVLDEIGPFCDSPAQDYDYYLRLSLRYPVVFHGGKLVSWRCRSDSMSGERSQRSIHGAVASLPVLVRHRRRCRPSDRALLEEKIAGEVLIASYGLMTLGREGSRLTATRKLLSVIGSSPWPPIAALHLAGLWAPDGAFELGSRMTRSMRGGR